MGVTKVYLQNHGIDPDSGIDDMTDEEFQELMDNILDNGYEEWLEHPDGIRACEAAYETR
jgi:hypothetical protein